MPLYNSYVISSYKGYIASQLKLARAALKKEDMPAARKFIRTALVLSYRRRTAKRDLRLGHQLQSNFTTPDDHNALDAYLAHHPKLLGQIEASSG